MLKHVTVRTYVTLDLCESRIDMSEVITDRM